MQLSIPKLSYPYDALEPFIDVKTMEIHHSKHHQTYTDNLNKALEKHPEINTDILTLLKDLTKVPEDIRVAVKNNGGGFVNHNFFWDILAPTGQKPQGKVSEAINKTFGSFDKFKEQFANAALTRFGSGWAWLVLNNDKLEITSTANQDSPISEGKMPLLTLDVWEHSYYIKHMWNRKAYVEDWWHVVNWTRVNELYEKALKK
jgi:Fe-Mn family superoxide dismutase